MRSRSVRSAAAKKAKLKIRCINNSRSIERKIMGSGHKNTRKKTRKKKHRKSRKSKELRAISNAIEVWVQCDSCHKWRSLHPRISSKDLPEIWLCEMNTWDIEFASCNQTETVKTTEDFHRSKYCGGIDARWSWSASCDVKEHFFSSSNDETKKKTFMNTKI